MCHDMFEKYNSKTSVENAMWKNVLTELGLAVGKNLRRKKVGSEQRI